MGKLRIRECYPTQTATIDFDIGARSEDSLQKIFLWSHEGSLFRVPVLQVYSGSPVPCNQWILRGQGQQARTNAAHRAKGADGPGSCATESPQYYEEGESEPELASLQVTVAPSARPLMTARTATPTRRGIATPPPAQSQAKPKDVDAGC